MSRKKMIQKSLVVTNGNFPKFEAFFSFIKDALEKGEINRKDVIKLEFSPKEKMQLFEFFSIPHFPEGGDVPLNESEDSSDWISPLDFMNLLSKHMNKF